MTFDYIFNVILGWISQILSFFGSINIYGVNFLQWLIFLLALNVFINTVRALLGMSSGTNVSSIPGFGSTSISKGVNWGIDKYKRNKYVDEQKKYQEKKDEERTKRNNYYDAKKSYYESRTKNSSSKD